MTTTQVVCCTCLEQPTPDIAYYSLYSDPSAANELNLKEKLLLCIPEFEEVVSDYGENAWMCRICYEALCWSYNFRKMCLEVKKKLEKDRNHCCVRIKEEAIDIDEMKINTKDNDAVLKTEISTDEGSKNNSFVDIEETFGGGQIETEVPTEEDPLADSLFVIASEETIKKDANRKGGKRKKKVSFFQPRKNIRQQKAQSKRNEICIKEGNTKVDLTRNKKISVFRPSKNVRHKRKTSSTRKETNMSDGNATVDLKPKKQISAFRSSKNIRHQRKTSTTRKGTNMNVMDPKLKQRVSVFLSNNLNGSTKGMQTDKNTQKENNKNQARKLIGKPKSKVRIDESLLIEKACRTIPVLKEKNVSPKLFKCFVKIEILGKNQLEPSNKRKTGIDRTSVQHQNKQKIIDTTTHPSLEPLSPTQDTNDDIDNGKEVNLHHQEKQKLVNTTTHQSVEPLPPTQETDDDIDSGKEVNLHHQKKQKLLNTTTHPSLETLPPTQEIVGEIDNGKEVNLNQQKKQKLLNTTTHPSLEPLPPTQETSDDDDSNIWDLHSSDTPSLEEEGDDDDDDDEDYIQESWKQRKSDRSKKFVQKPVKEPTDECIETDDDDDNNDNGIQESWKHRVRNRRKRIEQTDELLEGDENENHLKKKRKIRNATDDTLKKISKTLENIWKVNGETPKPENDIGTCVFFFNVTDEMKKHDFVFLTVVCPTCKNLFNNKYYDNAHKYVCGKTLSDFEENNVTLQCGMCNEVFDDLDTLNSHCDTHRYEKSVVEQQISPREREKCDTFCDLSEGNCLV